MWSGLTGVGRLPTLPGRCNPRKHTNKQREIPTHHTHTHTCTHQVVSGKQSRPTRRVATETPATETGSVATTNCHYYHHYYYLKVLQK